jgi:hypothetical protein
MTPRALRLALAAADRVDDPAIRVELTESDWWDAGCPWPRLHGLAVATGHLESAVIATSGRRTPIFAETFARSHFSGAILADHQPQGACHGRP